MIALIPILLQVAAPTTAPAPVAAAPLPGTIGRQALPKRGCAAYLWTRAPEPELIAMAVADPAAVRLALGGATADRPRVEVAGGDAGYGFARRSTYRLPDGTAELELTLAARPDLADGAAVTEGMLTIRRQGTDTAVMPVGGLVGCAPADPRGAR